MTGYARKWDCPNCGRQEEGVDWPLEGDELCERCKEKGRKVTTDGRTFDEGFAEYEMALDAARPEGKR